MSHQTTPTFAGLVQEFFTDYMVQQRALSPCTVASYRDTFVLLLRFAQDRRRLPAHVITMTDLNARFLADFLDHLESQRHNSVRSRNVRLAAVRAFLKFAARRDPANLGVIENALAVPMKRFERKLVGFVPHEQMLAVIDVATDTWIGQRDRLMLTLMFNTGARVLRDRRRARGRCRAWAEQQHPAARQGAQAAFAAALEDFGSGRARLAALESAVAPGVAAVAHARRTCNDQGQRRSTAEARSQRGCG